MKFSFSNIIQSFLKILKNPPEESIKEKMVMSNRDLLRFQEILQADKDQIHQPFVTTSSEERKIIRTIREQVFIHNENNVTRTSAYLKYFLRNPNVHWAFLAHMVSRNGGYYMTDLKSSFFKDIIPSHEQKRYFLFLERCNAYIFQDAFPQLLLYEYCVKVNKPMFHLLKGFNVSSFMIPLWESFFNNKNSEAITIGMIINEQKMLGERVLKILYQSHSVLDELPYKLQETLGLTTVLFPYRSKQSERYKLYGQEVKNFSDVDERITIGKKLYQILFSKYVFESSFQFANHNVHTGSRKDYWGWLFTNDEHSKEEKIYSPPLFHAWSNVEHSFRQKQDWFGQDNLDVIKKLHTLPEVKDYDLTTKIAGQYTVLQAFDHINESLLN
ncbi:DUF2515 family protein [Cytobacillus sp. FJAT-54145]|uniref:DUF2515 family protein n=1 Tax=Cytobacillus spartinae TaxID=3299023 RepID=A0ABW6KFU5_9BACI